MTAENSPEFPFENKEKHYPFDWDLVTSDVPKKEDFDWDMVLSPGVKIEKFDDYVSFIDTPKMITFDNPHDYTYIYTHTPKNAPFGAFAELPKEHFMTFPETPNFDFTARVPVEEKSVKSAVAYANKYKPLEDYLVFDGDVLYTTPAKETVVTVELADQKIQEAKDKLGDIATSDMAGGAMWYWAKTKESWETIRGCL